MDLRDARPHLNLYNPHWPLRTAYYDQPPAKFVFDENGRRGQALHSVISEGCIVSGGTVRNSVLGRSVFIHSYSHVEDSVVMDYAEIGRHARIRRAIIDKNVYVPDGEEIGYDLERDRQRFFVTDSGLVVIPKGPKRERRML
jgi:glucose-1-phosphate adenylyltransferase